MAARSDVVVIDNGTHACRAGFAGEDAPRAVCETIIGKPKISGDGKESQNPEILVGPEARARSSELRIRSPIEYGLICDFDEMEHIWEYIFDNQLKVNTADHALLLTEHAMRPKYTSEKITQIMMEKFNVPSLYLAAEEFLVLLTTGRSTGVVVNCSTGMPHMIPIYEGHHLPNSARRVHFPCRDLDYYLYDFMNKKGYPLSYFERAEVIRDIKAKLCYVALDFEEECRKEESSVEKTYRLPDGSDLTLGSERFKCPEGLFEPRVLNNEMPGITETLNFTILNCSKDIQDQLYGNIVLAGGNTMFTGMKERFKKEMTSLAPDKHISVIAPSEGTNAPWNGGSLLGNLSTFQDMCITKEEYDEYGPVMVHWKCF